MAQKTTPEERQMIKLIEKINVPQEQKTGWVEAVQNSGLTEEVAEEIRQVLITPTENEQPPEATTRTRYMMEFSQLVKRWRLSYQSRHFNRR
jgi:hypothetical protein